MNGGTTSGSVVVETARRVVRAVGAWVAASMLARVVDAGRRIVSDATASSVVVSGRRTLLTWTRSSASYRWLAIHPETTVVDLRDTIVLGTLVSRLEQALPSFRRALTRLGSRQLLDAVRSCRRWILGSRFLGALATVATPPRVLRRHD